MLLPTWVIPKDHKVTTALEEAYTGLFGNSRIGSAETEDMRKALPLTDKWTFSTNGVSIMGRNGIPVIGFGPGAEAQAHAPNEKTWKKGFSDLCRRLCCVTIRLHQQISLIHRKGETL